MGSFNSLYLTSLYDDSELSNIVSFEDYLAVIVYGNITVSSSLLFKNESNFISSSSNSFVFIQYATLTDILVQSLIQATESTIYIKNTLLDNIKNTDLVSNYLISASISSNMFIE